MDFVNHPTVTLRKGGSAQTFRGMLEYVQHHSPAIVVFENVDTIDDRGATSNLDILLAEMGNRGYEHQVIMSDAALFGLPARRRRVYVLFLMLGLACRPVGVAVVVEVVAVAVVVGMVVALVVVVEVVV